MIQKKVCMVGAFAVGKTSLVSQFVRGIFSEDYQTTVGVKISRKEVALEGHDVRLIVWDLHGEDDFHRVRTTYLRGASGILLVADGTRPETVETITRLREVARTAAGDVPMLCLANKHDLADKWLVEPASWQQLEDTGVPVIQTSAKSGAGVEIAFRQISERMVGKPAS